MEIKENGIELDAIEKKEQEKLKKGVDENSNSTKKDISKKVYNEKIFKKEPLKIKKKGKVLLVSKSFMIVDDGNGHGITLIGKYNYKPGDNVEY